MAETLTDEEIQSLLDESKPLPPDYVSRMQIRPKRGHKERELDLQGQNGSDFRIILRQSIFNPLDFSVVLAFRPPQSNVLFRLRRYNGKSHQHTNLVEGDSFYACHIHQATERYQLIGAREDSYALQTDRFSDFHQAVSCLLEDCGFELPDGAQHPLFQ